MLFLETIATLPGGWDLAHAIRLGIKPFAELGANSEALSGSQVDSPCSCRAIFESAPVAMLQPPIAKQKTQPSQDGWVGLRSSGDTMPNSGGIGPGRPGWLPTQVPHRSGLAHHAHPVPHLMNSRPAIRRRYVDMVQVTMYLPGFASTAHETAPPSLDGVPRVGSPASTVL